MHVRESAMASANNHRVQRDKLTYGQVCCLARKHGNDLFCRRILTATQNNHALRLCSQHIKGTCDYAQSSLVLVVLLPQNQEQGSGERHPTGPSPVLVNYNCTTDQVQPALNTSDILKVMSLSPCSNRQCCMVQQGTGVCWPHCMPLIDV